MENTPEQAVPEIALDEEIINDESVVTEVPVEAPQKDTVTPDGPIERKYVNANVTMQDNPRKPFVEDKKDKREPVGILSVTGTELTDFVSQQSFQANMSSLDEKYRSVIREGATLTFNEDVLENALLNDAEFVQTIEYDDKRLHAFVPKRSFASGDTLSGINAVAKIQRALNQGSFLSFPCWASGVWVTLRAPTTFELADYFDAVSEEIIELGKQSNGAVYGNTTVYLSKYLMDLVEKLVYDCSIKNFNESDKKLRDVLMVDELQTIAWALAVCMYPNGYPFEEACTVDVEKCIKTYKTLLNVGKLYWVDKKQLTKWQIQFMSDKNAKRSLDEIRKYQLESSWLQSESFGYTGFKVLIKTPTIGEHISSGYRWIADVEQSIRQTINNLPDAKLNNLMMERAGLTLLRSYAHYVTAFVYDDGTAVNGKSDIDATLNNMCTSPDVVTKFTEDMKKHISASTISMIAIPRYKCPECGEDNHADEQVHPHLIPIDGAELFFALRDRKLQLT